MNPHQRVSRSAFLPILALIASCSAPVTSTSNWSNSPVPAPSTDSTTAGGEPSAVDSGATGPVPEAGTWHPPAQQPTPAEDAALPVTAEAAAPPTWPPASDAATPALPDSGSSTGPSLYPPTNETAQDFCSKYQMYCGFGGSQRYTDMNACVMNYNANPQQQGCYVYHLDAAIAGTATLCTSPPTQQCFDIHCPHATGMGGYCM